MNIYGKSLRLLSSAPGRPAAGDIGEFPLRSLLRQSDCPITIPPSRSDVVLVDPPSNSNEPMHRVSDAVLTDESHGIPKGCVLLIHSFLPTQRRYATRISLPVLGGKDACCLSRSDNVLVDQKK